LQFKRYDVDDLDERNIPLRALKAKSGTLKFLLPLCCNTASVGT